MSRRTFYSFHYKPDNWRAAQIRNAGVIEGNTPVSDNDWENVKRGGEAAIQHWIDNQLYGRSCTVVLIGSQTAGRKWINYEIKKSWDDGKGLVGIYIHGLKDRGGKQSFKGKNPFDVFPFDAFKVGDRKLSHIVKAYDPPSMVSTKVYEYITDNLEAWVEEAASIRQNR